MASANGNALLHLVVGKHSAQRRTPVYHNIGLVSQAVAKQYLLLLLLCHSLPLGSGKCCHLAAGSLYTAIAALFELGNQRRNRLRLLGGEVVVVLEHLDERPLGPLVVFGLAGAELAIPVVAEANLIELLAVAANVYIGGNGRVLSGLDGILLGR